MALHKILEHFENRKESEKEWKWNKEVNPGNAHTKKIILDKETPLIDNRGY